ncbi:MAG: TetR/AcrR family transcriptional regulator [Woeseiaceae bacterium]
MRYAKEHKIESRNNILSSALKLFSHRGFDNVSIDEIMANAGLTRGTFYAHFKNKQDLYTKSILSANLNVEKDTSNLADGKSQFKKMVTDYLEADYSNPDILPCPLACLVTDVANREPEVRTAYATSFVTLNLQIKNLLSLNTTIDEETILAITSMMIGTVAISRTIPKSATKKLLSGCKKTVFRLIDTSNKRGRLD